VTAVGLFVLFVPLPAATSLAAGAASNVEAVEKELLGKAAENIETHRKADATVRVQTGPGKPIADAVVEVRQLRHEFLFGCIIFDLVWSDDPYKPALFQERFKGLFNFAVFPFYWRRYEPQPGQTARDETLKVVRWCRENGITTKGHPLVWTNRSGVPDWLRGQAVDAMEEQMLGRVRREVGAFAGEIDVWDVVNEPVNTRAWDNVEGRDYTRDPIPRIADYVEKAFRAAREANPKAHLILNEYNTIAREDVRERFYQLAAELKRRETPLSGLGIQAHEPREHWYPPREVWKTFDRLASLGYPLHITEFIPQSGGKEITGGWRKGTWTEQTQAEFAEQTFRLSFGHPAVVSVNWWGFSDRRIWLPGGGLVTDQYEPKPVYERLKRLIHQQWNTRAKGKTGDDGCFRFRGFRGTYAVTVVDDGKPQTFDARLEKDAENRWIFTRRDDHWVFHVES
jgi:GH35 family endo-1,4-beta-xylanase